MGVFDDDGHLLKHLFKANVGLLQTKERKRKRRKEGGETGGKGEITFLINTSHFSCGFRPSFYFKLTRSVMDPMMWLKINDNTPDAKKSGGGLNI